MLSRRAWTKVQESNEICRNPTGIGHFAYQTIGGIALCARPLAAYTVPMPTRSALSLFERKAHRMPVKDPVCGMEIEPQAAFAARQSKGQTYYFCSENCVKQFDATPEKYAAAVPSATTGVSEGASGRVRLELSLIHI